MQSKNFVNNDFLRNQTYNSIKDQLQSQNEALLRERSQLQKRFGKKNQHGKQNYKRPSGFSQNSIIGQNQFELEAQPRTTSNFGEEATSTTDRIRQKIHEVIKLCDVDHNSGTGQFRQIIQAQKQILSYLQQPSPSKSQSNSKRKLNSGKMQKVGKVKSIREEIANNGFNHLITDDAMEMIEEIQRKTLLEIQSLRMDKIMLMKKLNQEVKAHNQQKRKRLLLEKTLKRLQQTGGRGNSITYPSSSYGTNIKNQNRSKLYKNQKIEEEDYDDQDEYDQEQQYEQQDYNDNEQQEQYAQHYPQNKPQKPVKTPNKNQQQYNQNKPQIPPQSRFRQAQTTGGFPSGNQIYEKISELQNENNAIKQNLRNSRNTNVYNPLKAQLKNQLAGLQNQIRQYQAVLQNQNNTSGNQIQNLVRQGQRIASQGQKLVKVRSKPQFNDNSYNEQIEFLRDRMRSLKSQNQALTSKNNSFKAGSISRPQTYSPHSSLNNIRYNQSSSIGYTSQTPKARTSTQNYESILNEMRKVTGI